MALDDNAAKTLIWRLAKLHEVGFCFNFATYLPKSVKRLGLTGKSLSEALLFAEHGENMLFTEIVSDIQNNFCTQHVLPMFCKKKSLCQRFTCMYVHAIIGTTYNQLINEIKKIEITMMEINI